MSDTAVQIEMRRRIGRHMLTSFAGAFVGIVLGGVGAAVVTMLAGTPPASWAGAAYGVSTLLGIAAIPAIGLYSTVTNLRCPQCNGLVAWQVSMKYSAFGSFASNECRHCGTTIFAPSASRRFLLVIIILAVLSFLGAAMFGAFMSVRRHHAHDAQPPASSAP